jgi:hypothetical protein
VNIVLLLVAYLLTTTAFANETKKLPSKSKEVNKKTNWQASGYIDGSYNHLLRSNQFTSGVFNRVYDLNPDGVTLHQASLTLGYQPTEGLGGLINPIFGKDTLGFFVPYGWDPFLGITQAGFAIPQGYLQYAQNSFTLIGGIFYSLAGAEYIDPTKDSNFSRSILFGYAEPNTHLGFRGTYIVNKVLTLIGGINNGWDSIRDTSRRKTLELSLIYTPSTLFSLVLLGYSGGQRAADRTDFGPVSTRKLFNLIATINPTKKITLIASYDYGIQSKAALPDNSIEKAIWDGFAGYINYQFNEKWRTSVRGELFNDRNGYSTGVVQKWKEVTLTIGYAWLENFELRAETRHDISNVSSFIRASRRGTSNNQQSFALEGVVKFS